MSAVEINFDGLVGPTHNYAGLSFGNIASQSNRSGISNPKEAALQGLQKMKALKDAGFKQGILLPHERPYIPVLKQLGFQGTDEQILLKAAQQDKALIEAVSSASCMWTANAATVSPSADTGDRRVHFTAANLNAKFHRSIEPETTTRVLKAIFRDPNYFAHHDALPPVSQFGDEGAANHTRFCADYDKTGVELFVYGQQAFGGNNSGPSIYPARQTLEASQAIARLHGLGTAQLVFAQQKPQTIDAGVFHNDVISVGNKNVFFFHEESFTDNNAVLKEIDQKLQHTSLIPVMVRNQDVSLQSAVSTYLFNSQLLSKDNGEMLLVVPGECRENSQVASYLDKLVNDMTQPIREVRVFDLKQSMKNGGGPACLRLRVSLNPEELAAINPQVMLTDSTHILLENWIQKHYRDRLSTEDLADPTLLNESRAALDELTQILQLGSVYPFQR